LPKNYNRFAAQQRSLDLDIAEGVAQFQRKTDVRAADWFLETELAKNRKAARWQGK
jgi:hypothetical protein